MPAKAELDGHAAIVGPGLDDVLEPGYRLVILDDFYADLYGDYVFLGYDTFVETVDWGRGDLVGLYSSAVLLSGGRSVIVCGKRPWSCLGAAAAWRTLFHGLEPREALLWAAERLQPLYGVIDSVPAPMHAALAALHELRGLAGPSGLAALMSLAGNYSYGEGRLHYGEAISWAHSLRLGSTALGAAALHFLAEGPGSAATVLERRLEALGGEETLVNALGGWAKEALGEVRRWARSGGGVLELIEGLNPGGEAPLYVERGEGEVLLYCGPSEEPPRPCLGAAKSIEEALGVKPRLRLEEPPFRSIEI